MVANNPTPPSRSRRSIGGAALIALGLATLAACSTEGRPFEELVRDGDRYLSPETLEPYTGTAFATFEGQAGVLVPRSRLFDDAYDGPFETVFADQKLSAKEVYADGVLHGPYEWYFESGALFEQGMYKNGKLEGPYRAYWENGDLYEEGSYRAGLYDEIDPFFDMIIVTPVIHSTRFPVVINLRMVFNFQ